MVDLGMSHQDVWHIREVVHIANVRLVEGDPIWDSIAITSHDLLCVVQKAIREAVTVVLVVERCVYVGQGDDRRDAVLQASVD